MEESLSLEETNKLRISLGLKPLKADPPINTTATTDTTLVLDSSTESQDRRAIDNWKTHQSTLETNSARRARAEGIKKARDAAKRFAVLEGKGLGEADENEEDTTTWVRKMKKRQKKLAEKLAKEKEEELEMLARETKDYTVGGLKGMRVGHDLEELVIGEEGMVLILKDSTIREDEEEDGDELVSTTLAERERLKERLELKKKKPVYNPHEAAGGDTSILTQYDDEINGKKRKRFVLDGSGNTEDMSDVHRKEIAEGLKAKPITLDIPKSEIMPDYVDPATIKIRKPKKKNTRKKAGDIEDPLALSPTIKEERLEADGEIMEVDNKPTHKPKRTYEDVSFIDDDDLQSSLAMQRKMALKKRKILKPDDLARQLREESNAEDTQMKGEDDNEVGLVIDETTEFVTALKAPVIPERRKSRSAPVTTPTASAMTNSPEFEENDSDTKMEDGEGDQKDLGLIASAPPEISSTGLDEEMTISRGVGATLAMLNQRGLLKRDEEADNKINLLRDREKFRIEKKIHELEAEEKAKQQRLRDRQSGKFDRMSAREREEHARWENRQRDLQEAREMAQRFKEYKPDVNLSYKDEFGRDMTQKEAFKHLSHQFHGKGSGKAKTEKRLKKIEDEKKREAASSLNSTSATAVQSAAKKSKQAGVRLM
ncbi:SART-1 protein [Morchella snyderi]|nr:SART-1 protein [Morchella snyderi]